MTFTKLQRIVIRNSLKVARQLRLKNETLYMQEIPKKDDFQTHELCSSIANDRSVLESVYPPELHELLDSLPCRELDGEKLSKLICSAARLKRFTGTSIKENIENDDFSLETYRRLSTQVSDEILRSFIASYITRLNLRIPHLYFSIRESWWKQQALISPKRSKLWPQLLSMTKAVNLCLVSYPFWIFRSNNQIILEKDIWLWFAKLAVVHEFDGVAGPPIRSLSCRCIFILLSDSYREYWPRFCPASWKVLLSNALFSWTSIICLIDVAKLANPLLYENLWFSTLSDTYRHSLCFITTIIISFIIPLSLMLMILIRIV